MSFSLSVQQISDNISKLASYMQSNQIEALYVPSFDEYISEYVPSENCPRYYVTGLSSSMAECVALKNEVRVYADGRYHLQMDQEIKAAAVVGFKTPSGFSTRGQLIEDLVKSGIKKLTILAERTPLEYLETFQKYFEVRLISQNDVLSLLNWPVSKKLPVVKFTEHAFTPETIEARLGRLQLKEKEFYYLSALDDVAWITNLRGYHLPNNSVFYGRALVSNKKIKIFVEDDIEFEAEVALAPSLEVMKYPKGQWGKIFKERLSKLQLEKISIDENSINAQDYFTLKNHLADEQKILRVKGLVAFKSIKTINEMKEFERSYLLGSRAVANTVKWLKEQVKNGNQVSEYDYSHQTGLQYQALGAKAQSFKTISGFGENGAFVHYSHPKKDRFASREDLILLDSGAFFESGFATDCTRTFLADSRFTEHAKFAEYKRIYTLVMKAQIQAESAVFREGTLGNAIDQMARNVLLKHGLDFNHGLGHGVGIAVHEGGVNLSPSSRTPLRVGQVVSVEPGCYLTGQFGVRCENVVTVEKHPKYSEYLCFKPLIWVPWEDALIDQSLMTHDEFEYYNWYQNECKKRGISI